MSLQTSREANFRLIQAFNWSINNFDEIHISQGLDWAFPSLSHYSSWLLLVHDAVSHLLNGHSHKKVPCRGLDYRRQKPIGLLVIISDSGVGEGKPESCNSVQF